MTKQVPRRMKTQTVTRASLRQVEVTLSMGEREDLIRALDEGRLDDVLSPWTRNRMIEDLSSARGAA